jgi:hypothetical protein
VGETDDSKLNTRASSQCSQLVCTLNVLRITPFGLACVTLLMNAVTRHGLGLFTHFYTYETQIVTHSLRDTHSS